MCEEGIAAALEIQRCPVSAEDEQRLAWLRQVVEWQRDVSDPNEFLSTLKVDLYPEEVYTFTPKARCWFCARVDSDRLRLLHSHRGRAQLHRREGQRTHGSAAPQAAFRRHRRSDHPARTQAEPRLVGVVKSSRARNKIKHC